MKIELRFWGVRGSLPSPGVDTLVVGGNTTCVTLRCANHLLVFDAGTGIRRLGEYLERSGLPGLHGSIFFSHYHWDHIQGLPFFMPSRRVDNRFILFGESKAGFDLREILSQQMQDPYFPVGLGSQEALVTFVATGPGERIVPTPGITVRTERLRHPNGAIGYRAEVGPVSVCVVTDHEHPADGLDERVVEFARGATVLIHEGQYTPEEKSGPKAGWGHSSWREAALTAAAAGVGRLFISHHDPARTDAEVFDIQSSARDVFAATDVATESTILDLSLP